MAVMVLHQEEKLQICSQLNRGPENPQRGIALVPFCIVCFVAASFEHIRFCLRLSVLSVVVPLTSLKKGAQL